MHCANTLHAFQNSSDTTGTTVRQLCALGKALHPILQVNNRPTGRPELALRVFRDSFTRQTIDKILKRLADRPYVCASQDAAGLVQQLVRLPNEILQYFVAPDATPSTLSDVCSILGETSRLLQKLHKLPARSYQVSTSGAIFETRIKFGGISYITALNHDKRDPSSTLVKPSNESCDYIVVQLDSVGITAVEFYRNGRSVAGTGRLWSYAVAIVDGYIHVTSKVYETEKS
jgi:hypothetical protein